jgi:hypothetical protein
MRARSAHLNTLHARDSSSGARSQASARARGASGPPSGRATRARSGCEGPPFSPAHAREGPGLSGTARTRARASPGVDSARTRGGRPPGARGVGPRARTRGALQLGALDAPGTGPGQTARTRGATTRSPRRAARSPSETHNLDYVNQENPRFPARNPAFDGPAPPDDPPREGMRGRVQGFRLTPRASTPAPSRSPPEPRRWGKGRVWPTLGQKRPALAFKAPAAPHLATRPRWRILGHPRARNEPSPPLGGSLPLPLPPGGPGATREGAARRG